MAFNVKIGNKVIKDTYYSIAPINWLLRIFAKSKVKKYKNELVSSWSLTETFSILSVLCTINVFFLVYKIQRLQNQLKNEFTFSESIQFVFIIAFVEYLLDLIFVFKMRQKCVPYLKFYAKIDKILSAPNFSAMRKMNLGSFTCFMIAFVISSMLDYFAWFVTFGWETATLYVLDYVYVFINNLTALDMVANVIQIECRLKVMVDLIEEYTTSMPLTEGLILVKDLPKNGDGIVNYEGVKMRKVDTLKTVSYSRNLNFFSLSKYYLFLIEQVDYINAAYGFRLAAFLLNSLIYMTTLTNIILRILLGQLVLPGHSILLALSSAVRILNYLGVIVLLVHRCGHAYGQCARAVHCIDLAVVTRNLPSDLKTSLLDLRALILSRPVKFHGAEFFTIDHPLLVSLASIIITYTIILLQSLR